jgi:hypothetical protein
MALPIGLHLVYNRDYALTIIELNGAVIRDECLRRQICPTMYCTYLMLPLYVTTFTGTVEGLQWSKSA